ncbi:MAG: lipopolysaccharide biosynthesis protein, partial [Proteobacteria bacterium]
AAAATCGFLPFNFPRARIFLGDVGSGALGYLVAMLLLAVPSHQGKWWLALLPLSAFLIDAGFTLAGRMLAGERWWQPHVRHLYQAWARKLGGHATVTLAYAVFSLLAVIMMLAAVGWTPRATVGGVAVWYVSTGLIWVLLRKDVELSKETDQ